MTVTASTAQAGVIRNGFTTASITLTSVPAGATIILGIMNRTDETATISSIADDVNGTWTPDYITSPTDATYQTFRAWLAYRTNCAAGTTVITVTYSASINSNITAAYLTSDVGTLTFDQSATALNANLGTNFDSNTITMTGAGAIFGCLFCEATQSDPQPSADGANEARLTAYGGSVRPFLFWEPVTGAGTYGLETTADSTVAVFLAGSLLEPAGGSIVPQAMANYRMRAA